MSFPQPVIYYPMNINDVNSNKQLVNRASGDPVYDATITNSSYISQKNYKCGIGSWESPKNSISFSSTTTLTGYTINSTGISVSQDQLKMVITKYNNSGGGYIYYFTRTNTSEAWPTTTNQIQGSGSSQLYYRCGLTADGTRGVACVNGGLVYVFYWTGSIPSNWKRTDDTTTRAYFGLAITPDGSRMVASTDTAIFFSTWNGTNYNAFTTISNTPGIGIGISATGDRIVYGINANDGEWYIAFWNGTNYNKGILLPHISNTEDAPRTAYFSNDASILFLSYVYSSASIYYGKYDPISNSYGNFTGIATTIIPASLDTHGLCYIDGQDNGFLYVKPWGNTKTEIYIVTVTYTQPSYADQTNITLPTLPTTICGGSGSGYTVATWFRSNFNKNWARIFDFGDNTGSINIGLSININANGTGYLVYFVYNTHSTQPILLTTYLTLYMVSPYFRAIVIQLKYKYLIILLLTMH